MPTFPTPVDQPTTVKPTVDTTRTGEYLEVDFSRELTKDYESEAPLLTMLNMMRQEISATHIFKFPVGRQIPRESLSLNTTEIASQSGATEVDIPVENPEFFVEKDIVEVAEPDWTGNYETILHQLIVVSVIGNNVRVKAWDNTSGVPAIPASATIRNIGSSSEEGSDGRTSQQTIPSVYTQNIQVFEDYFQLTDITEADRHYTGPERSRLREERRIKHILDQEYMYFLSRFATDTNIPAGWGGTGSPRRQMSGVMEQIQTNVLLYGATLSKSALFSFMTRVHNPAYSAGMKRMVLASGDLLAEVQNLAEPAIRINTRETRWGPSITEVQHAGKVWEYIEAPVLSRARPGWGIVIHPLYLKKRPFKPTVYEMNVQANISKYIKDGFYSANAVEFRLEEVGGIIRPGGIPT
jgi:hypothetical protein